MDYTGLSAGAHTLAFTLSNKLGEPLTEEENLFFTETLFSFTAGADNTQIFTDGSTNINFNINELGSTASGATYRMRYEIVAGSGGLSSAGIPLSPSTLYDLAPGNFSWQFASDLLGGGIKVYRGQQHGN